MRCSKARILLSESLDGELSRGQQLALERHISACAVCAQEKAEFASVRDAMSLWSDEEPSEWLAASFAHKLRQFEQERTAPKPKRLGRWFYGTAATGAAVALVMVGFFLHSLTVRPVTPPKKHPGVRTATTQARHPAGTVKPPDVVKAPVNPPAPDTGSTHVTTGSAAPASGPGQVTKPYSGSRYSGKQTLPSRGGGIRLNKEAVAQVEAQHVGAGILTAGAVQDTAAGEVTSNLGEVRLAMNQTVERVRGSIQEAVDVAVLADAGSADNSMYTHGGSSL